VLSASVTHNDAVDHRDQKIVQPLGLGPFLEGDVNGPPHAPEELEERRRLGRQNAPRDHASAL
jgi:hypothetical protein